MNKFLKVVLVVFVGYLLPLNANATTASCIDSTTGTISPSGKIVSSSIDYFSGNVDSASCGPWVGNDNNDLTALTGGYGYSDWVELDKADNGANGTNITGTGWGTTSGTFSFTDSLYSQYLIVLKFDGVFSTFLSDTVATNWGWDTDVDGDGGFAISHLTVYVREPQSVPEASTIILFGFGLLGLLVARRRSV